MLQTNHTCQISDLPEHLNVSDMAQNLEKRRKENSSDGQVKSVTTFVLKARNARIGNEKRSHLLPAIQEKCKQGPVVLTNDFLVNETEFEKYNAGEIILIPIKEKNTRICETHYVCSKDGPRACGYGWTNPDPDAPSKGFSFHQVSDGSICVNCNIYYPGGPQCPDNGFCECKNIRTKKDLMDCGKDYILSDSTPSDPIYL